MTKRFPGVIALNRVSLGFRRGRSARGRRRERRRQVDPDEHSGGRISAERGRDPDRRQAGSLRLAAGQPRRGHRRGVPGARPLPDHERRRKRNDVGHWRRGPWPRLSPGRGCEVETRAALLAARNAKTRSRREGRRPVGSRRCNSSRSPRRCVSAPGCSCSTSRTQQFPSAKASGCSTVVRQLRGEGVPSCTFRIASRKCSISRIASRSCATAGMVETLENQNLTEDRLIRAMVGRDVGQPATSSHGPSRSEAKGRAGGEDLTAAGIDDVSFSVRSGEILGHGRAARFRQGWSWRGLVRPLRPARLGRD